MAKTFGGNRKWTTGRSRIVRPSDQAHFLRGLKESAKMVFDRLTWGGAQKAKLGKKV